MCDSVCGGGGGEVGAISLFLVSLFSVVQCGVGVACMFDWL